VKYFQLEYFSIYGKMYMEHYFQYYIFQGENIAHLAHYGITNKAQFSTFILYDFIHIGVSCTDVLKSPGKCPDPSRPVSAANPDERPGGL